MQLVLHRAILECDYLKIGLYGRPPEVWPLTEEEPRSQIFNWLPGQMSQSVILWDHLALRIKRIGRGQTKIAVST